MKKKSLFLLLAMVAVVLAAATGCKKKSADQAAPKTVEGSGSAAAPRSAGNDLSGSGSAATGSTTPEPNKPAEAKNIVETAKAAGTFNTLLKAIEAADLTERLSGPGPFTVFAPTDEAFAKIPSKDLDALLTDKSKLEGLLQYHVIASAISSKDLASQKAIKTVQGADVAIDSASGIKVAGATLVTPDITASNGVIHAIDTVLVVPQ